MRDIPDRSALEAVFGWWREAGVDYAFDDVPAKWLQDTASAAPAIAPPPPLPPPVKARSPVERVLDRADSAPVAGNPADWPAELAAFRTWWLTGPAFADIPVALRLAPEGRVGDQLAIVTPSPASQEDKALLGAIFQAAAVGRDDVYLASALPAAMTLPDWPELSDRGLADLTRHHLTLARPARVLVFGRALAPVFGIPAASARMAQTISLGERSAPLLLAPGLGELARSAEQRKAFWTRWLDWTA